jgi:hypothetical protein
LTDAYDDDGMIILTIMKARSLEHHLIKGYLKGRDEGPPVRKGRTSDPDGGDRR